MSLKTISLIATIFFLISLFTAVLRPRNGLYIKFMDVGQGDAAFIRTPENYTMLIDGGGNYQSDQTLNQEMFFPLCHLDYLVVTHPHSDHIKGLEKILKRCSVGFVMFNDVSYESPDLDVFKHLLKNNNVINVFAGDELSLGKINIKILWPEREFLQTRVKNLNNISAVLFLDYGNFEALFMGDLEEDYQAKLDLAPLKVFINGKLNVIKIAHHGSYNGVYMPLINELKPEKCVVSVGSDNTFGHPDKKSMESLTAAGCEVLRTDLLGDIVITAD
jgi:competence protein ComEC